MRSIVTLLAFIGVLFAATPSLAQLAPPKDPRARAENDEGNRLYKLGEFKEAIGHYEAGARLSDAPVFLYNLAQSHRQLGNYEKAIWFYERFLSSGHVDPEVAMYVRNFIKVMKAKLAQEVRDTPPTEPEPRSEPASPPEANIRSPEKPEPWHADIVGWSLAGAGFVAGGVGIGFLVSASGLDDQAKSEADQTRRDQLRSDASSRRTIGTVVTVTCAAVLVAGIIKLAIAPKPHERPAPLSVAVGPGTILLSGRF